MVGEDGDAIGRYGLPPNQFTKRFSRGVAIELMIQLANMTQTDP